MLERCLFSEVFCTEINGDLLGPAQVSTIARCPLMEVPQYLQFMAIMMPHHNVFVVVYLSINCITVFANQSC